MALLVWAVGKGNMSKYTAEVYVRVEALLTSHAKIGRKEKMEVIKSLSRPLY